MFIPESVLESVEKRPIDNDYIYGAEEMYDDLTSRDQNTYKNFHMSILANALEMYYKGVLQASGLQISDYVMSSHNLYPLYSEIATRISPLGNETTPQEKRDVRTFLNNLTHLYIDAKYHHAQISYEDFQKCRTFLTNQRERCMSLLDPTRSWDVKKKTEPNNLPKAPYKPSEDAMEMTDMDEDMIEVTI